jgi:ATPase subunit of ABC transporter with duplicated ATPase domains
MIESLFMSHITLKDLCLSFPHKVCFESFSAHVPAGSRIGIIGVNGSGKSTLLKMLKGEACLTDGAVYMHDAVQIGYVSQLIECFDSLSGGQRFNAALTAALANDPDVLLLDEPTNHLDRHNRKSLMRLLRGYQGTLIVVTHDVELLRTCIDTLWHIDQGKIHVFTGCYDDYMRERDIKRNSIEQELNQLNLQKKDVHQSLMKEQRRAKSSGAQGEKNIKQRKWPTVVSGAKARRAEETSGRKKCAMRGERDDLLEKLSDVRLPEVIKPTFSLNTDDIGERTLVAITDGSVGYSAEQPIVSGIHLSILSGERIAIAGDNGSGKSTLIKGILGDPAVTRSGAWVVPKMNDIGYLDQSYATLDPTRTVFETIQTLVPTWTHAEIRKHLNDFLFRKNEEVNTKVANLSGGERARLSLAQIAAKTPKLLILDEVTNNLDLEARAHVIDVLVAYPGAMIVISHDLDFLKAINMQSFYRVAHGAVNRM